MTKISDSDCLTTLSLWSPCNHNLSSPKTKNQVITNIAIVYAPIRYKRIKDMGVIIEGEKILNWTLWVEWNEALICCASVPYALTWSFITFSTPVAAGWLCQTSSLDILTFLRVANWIPWLEWGSIPQQPSEEVMSLFSAALTDSEGMWYFSFAMLPPAVWISALKDNCHDPGSTPKEVCEMMTTRKFCGTDWANICWELLRSHWSSLDLGGHWRPIVIQTMLSSVIHVPLFEIPWYLYKNTVKKDQQ